jgi:hypothetical protein
MPDKVEYVVNPQTNKYIKVNGPTYNKLKDQYTFKKSERVLRTPPKPRLEDTPISPKRLREISEMKMHSPSMKKTLTSTTQPYLLKKLAQQLPKEKEGRGSRTRGWAAASPKKGSDRHMLKEQCGNKCFLKPEDEAFPICARCVNGKCDCKVDPRAMISAKVRAGQYKYDEVTKAIQKLEKKMASPTSSPRRQ